MKKILIVLMLLFAGVSYAFPPIDFGDDKFLRIFYEAQFGFSYRDVGSGPDSEDPTYNLNFRRNRLGFVGTYNPWLSFYFNTEYIESRVVNPLYVDVSDSGQNFYVLDAQIRLTPYEYFNVYLGKLKNNLTRENLESCYEPLTLDRSYFVATPYKTSRDIGVAIWGNLLNEMVQYRVDAMDGHTPSATDPTPESSLRYTARLMVSIFEPEAGYGLAGTYMGESQVLTVGGAYQYEANPVYSDVASKSGAKNYNAYSFDIFYEQPTPAGAFTVSAAYLDIDFDDAYKGVDPAPGSYGLNGQKNGYYVKAGYMLPMYVGTGKLQFFGRYDNFNFANLNNTVTNTNFYDQNVSRIGIGANYYIKDQDLKLTAEYSMTNYDKEDPNDPNYQDFNSFDLFLQVRI